MDQETSVKPKNGGNQSIWSTLLNDISSSTPSRFSHIKSIVLLGDDLSGKSVLAAKLQDVEETHRGSGLDFQTIEVHDDDVDESTLCRLWIVDGHLAYRSLLKFALPDSMYEHALVALVVDMSQPWNIVESLNKWLGVLHEHLDSLGISLEDLKKSKDKLLADYQGYVDVSEDGPGSKVGLPTAGVGDDTAVVSLGELALSDNLGLPLVVICTKCDCMESLENEQEYKEEHFDYIQHYLRKFCLQRGAALVYTSIKEGKNIEVLKKYLLHKLYGFKFSCPASVVDRDSVFVPAGWDSEKKINIISDHFSDKISLTDNFESVIPRPLVARKLVQDMKELIVDEEQSFLSKAQVFLSKSVPPPGGAKAGAGDGVGLPSSRRDTRVSQEVRQMLMNPTAPTTEGRKSTKDVGKGASNERMLANFFNSLLNKKPISPGPATLPSGGKVPKTSTPVQKGKNSPASAD